VTISNISHNFQADMEREDYADSFWKGVYTFCPGPSFPAKLRKRTFITLQALTCDPILTSCFNYCYLFPLGI